MMSPRSSRKKHGCVWEAVGAIALCLTAACTRASHPVLTFAGSVVGSEGAVLAAQIARFRERNPSLQVEVRVTPDAADQRHQLYVQWLNAHASEPDVLQLDVVWTPEFAAAGWIEALGCADSGWLEISGPAPQMCISLSYRACMTTISILVITEYAISSKFEPYILLGSRRDCSRISRVASRLVFAPRRRSSATEHLLERPFGSQPLLQRLTRALV